MRGTRTLSSRYYADRDRPKRSRWPARHMYTKGYVFAISAQAALPPSGGHNSWHNDFEDS